jgi:hypothetical protein
MKKIIRLTESDLHRIVKEAVNKILSEDGEGGMGSGGFDARGMSLDFGGDTQPAEDKGATSSLRNKTYIAPASVTKEKDPTLSRPVGDIAMNKSEKPVGHKG